MIYTVTLNPSLDYIVAVDDFKLGYTNRTSSELMLPGGKGTNVSIVLKISVLIVQHLDLWQVLPEMRLSENLRKQV